jgi:HEAT repeat protein
MQVVQGAGAAAAPALIAGLKESDPRTRLQCFKYLRTFHAGTDLDAISDATIKEEDFSAQQYGVMAIASFKNDAAVDRLKKVLAASANMNIRTVALREIASISGQSAIPFFLSILNDAHQPLLVRSNAGRELARLGDASGHAVAVEALRDNLALTREAGIQTLGLLGRQGDVSLLEAKTNDPSESERTKLIARKALQHHALTNLSEAERLPYLEKSLADSHAWVRAWAISELAEQKDVRARTILKGASSQAEHPGNREATEALQTIKEH